MQKMPGLTASCLLLCAVVHVAAAITDGLLPNGDFERGPRAADLINGTVIGRRGALPEWEVSGFVEYIPWGKKQGDMLLIVPEGSYAVRLGNEASIRQPLPRLSPALRYSLTFSAARTCAQAERLNVSVTPSSSLIPIQTTFSGRGWDTYAWAFDAPKFPIIPLLSIHNPGREDDPACGPLIDAVALCALPPARPGLTGGNLVRNPGFEEGPFFLPNVSWGVLIPPSSEDAHSPLPGWSVPSVKPVKHIDRAHFAVPAGSRAVELVAGREGALAQTVNTAPGRTYSLTFSIGDAGDGCVGDMEVEAFAGSAAVRIPYQSQGKGEHKRAVLRFVAGHRSTVIVFQSLFYYLNAEAALCGPVVDDVVLAAV